MTKIRDVAPENALIHSRRDASAKELTYWISKGLGKFHEAFGIIRFTCKVTVMVKEVKLLLSAP